MSRSNKPGNPGLFDVPRPPLPPLLRVPHMPEIDPGKGEEYFKQAIIQEFNEQADGLDVILQQTVCESMCALYKHYHFVFSRDAGNENLHQVTACRLLLEEFKGRGLAGHHFLNGTEHFDCHDSFIKAFQVLYDRHPNIEQAVNLLKMVENKYQARCLSLGHEPAELLGFNEHECGALSTLREQGLMPQHLRDNPGWLQHQNQVTGLLFISRSGALSIEESVDIIRRLPVEGIADVAWEFRMLLQIGENKDDALQKLLSMPAESFQQYARERQDAHKENVQEDVQAQVPQL